MTYKQITDHCYWKIIDMSPNASQNTKIKPAKTKFNNPK